MEKKKWVKLAGFAMIVLLSLFVFTGCDGTVEEENGTGLVRFEEEDFSRGFAVGEEVDISADSLYWAYVAVKKSGLHTEGESQSASSAADGINVEAESGKFYKLRPVKTDVSGNPVKGLSADMGSFSYGEWLFKVYGYTGFDGTKFTGLVSEGNTVGSALTPVVYETVNSTTPLSVAFKLSPISSAVSDGILAFGTIYYTVPVDMQFYANSAIKVTISEGTDVIAEGVGKAGSANAYTGARIPLLFTMKSTVEGKGKDGKFSAGTHNFKVKVEYYTSTTVTGTASEGVTISERVMGVQFNKGITTVLYGDIDDVLVDAGDIKDTGFGVAVCKIGTKEYTSLAEAAKACTAATTITLLTNINGAGEVNPGANITIDCAGYFVRNLKIASGNTKTITLSAGTSKTFTFSGQGKKLNFFGYSASTAWISTDGGTLVVNAADMDVWFSGTIDDLTATAAKKDLTNNLGLHISGYVANTLTVTKGYIDLSSTASVNKITMGTVASSGDAWLHGTSRTYVGTITNIESVNNGTNVSALTANQKTAFASVWLDPNGGDGASTYRYIYGIDGMSVKIPDYPDDYKSPYGRKFGMSFFGYGYTGGSVNTLGEFIPGSSVPLNEKTYPLKLYTHWSRYLCFVNESAADATVKFVKGASCTVTIDPIQYSSDFGQSWTNMTLDNEVTLSGAGSRIYVKSVNNTFSSAIDGVAYGQAHTHACKLTGSKVGASGSIMSLLDGGAGTRNDVPHNCFIQFFYNQTALVKAPDLTAMGKLGWCCYMSMFAYSSITVAPLLLNATNRTAGAEYCRIFEQCGSLEKADNVVMVGELATFSYEKIFSGCTNLKSVKFTGKSPTKGTASGNGVTSGVVHAMGDALKNCSSLEEIYVPFTSWLADPSYTTGGAVFTNNWVSGVPSTGTFHCPASLTQTKDTSHIPSGWTVTR